MLSKQQIYWISRGVTLLIVAGALGTLFITPVGIFEHTIDIIVRTHLMFLGTVMAHDASHGCLGNTKRANLWWGRIALIPSTVPYTNFRKTHWVHHARTNMPGEDPDHFVKPNHWFEIPFRSVALPHYWLIWLAKRGRLKKGDFVEILGTYVVLITVFGGILSVVGPERLAMGMIPCLVLESIFLWYLFALRTHDGFSLGPEAERSHNYYGALTYWLTMGLSMHRAHHMHPHLSWLELRAYVEEDPRGLWARLKFARHVIPAETHGRLSLSDS